MHIIPIVDAKFLAVVVFLTLGTLLSGFFGFLSSREGSLVYKKYQIIVAVISWILILALLVMLFMDDPLTLIGFIAFIASVIVNWEAVQSTFKARFFKKAE